jgi:hypothetical protein
VKEELDTTTTTETSSAQEPNPSTAATKEGKYPKHCRFATKLLNKSTLCKSPCFRRTGPKIHRGVQGEK